MARSALAMSLAVSLAGTLLTIGTGTSGATVDARPAAVLASTQDSCHVPVTTPVATPVPGVPSDWEVTSFDGTQIRVHWFPIAAPGRTAPTVFMGPGWGEAGDTDTQGTGVLGDVPIKDLQEAGYNVLTWDPRGFGQSGGQAEVDSANYEARDVSTLISWVATRPGVQLDAPGDPRMGMVGGSYGGGIQLVTAATDCRVDAIVPIIAWHSLVTSLDKADTIKIGWSNLLSAASSTDHVDPVSTEADAAANQTGVITPAEQAWFASRGPAALVAHIHIPTLIVQGTVDTLFTLQEGVENYQILRHSGAPVSMLWFCGGHGVCLTPPGDQQLPVQAAVAWLDRYVKRDTSVPTGPGFRFVDQNGHTYSAPSYPLPAGAPVSGSGSGTLTLTAQGGSGPASVQGVSGQALAAAVSGITPARATHAVDLVASFGSRARVVVGAPRLTLTYRGTTPAGTRPTRVFAQLVDPTTHLVLGNQVTPIDVTLDGHTHTTSVPLEMVVFTGKAHATVELQLVATTVAYAQPRLGGRIDFTHIGLSLPVASGITAR